MAPAAWRGILSDPQPASSSPHDTATTDELNRVVGVTRAGIPAVRLGTLSLTLSGRIRHPYPSRYGLLAE